MNLLNLTPAERRFWKCLQAVTGDSIWAISIQEVVKDPTEEKFRTLVAELKSQYADDNTVMAKILQPDCIQTLIWLP